MRILKQLLVALAVCCAALPTFGQMSAQMTPGGTGYLEYLPTDYATSGEEYPVMIFLHGLGEKGNGTTELNRVAKHGPPKYINQGHDMSFVVDGVRHSLIVISPQLRHGAGSWPTNYIMEVVNHVKNTYNIDENRIYLTGLSLGGGGTWRCASDFPEIFAAIAPVCGAMTYSNARAKKIADANLPVWAFHGETDNVVHPGKSIGWVNAINSYNPDPEALLTIYPGTWHNAWDKAYPPNHNLHNPNVYEWLLSYNLGGLYAHAGEDQNFDLPAQSITLQGNVSGGSGAITYRWEQTAGAALTLGNTNTLNLNLSNLQEGTFTFKLTVTDAAGISDSDEINVTLNIPNVLPVAVAGPDRIMYTDQEDITVDGSGSYDTDGTITDYTWKQLSGPNDGYSVHLDLNNGGSATAPWNSSPVDFLSFRNHTTDNLTAKDGTKSGVTLKMANGWWGIDSKGLQTGDNSGPVPDAVAKTTLSFKSGVIELIAEGLDPERLYKFTFFASYGESFTSDRVTKYSVSDKSVTLNASNNKDKTVEISNVQPNANGTVKIFVERLNEAVLSAHLGALIMETGHSGMENANTPILTLSGLTEGDYIYQLSVTDNEGGIGQDDVKVSVQARSGSSNGIPVASAGADQQITLPTNSISLSGEASSDPDGDALQFSWVKISGPAAQIQSANSASTNVNGLTEGQYVFELTVSDGKGGTAKDQVNIVVDPKPNSLPIANAGADQQITLPTNSISLSGEASSDPDGDALQFSWVKISGPAAQIQSANSASTNVNGLTEGQYVFELTVSDGKGGTAKDQVNVTVAAAPVSNENMAPVAIAGEDRLIDVQKDTVMLSGTGSYDPDGEIVTYTWSKLSGPQAYRVLVDFNNGGNAPAPWNNTPVDFLSYRNNLSKEFLGEDGTNSGIRLQMVSGWWGYNDLGETTGDDSGAFPDAVMSTNLWFRSGTVHMKVKGLQPNVAYKFTFFGSRSDSKPSNRKTDFSIGSTTVTLNASQNTESTVQIANAYADSNGELDLYVARNSTALYAYLGAMTIEANVPVSTQPNSSTNTPEVLAHNSPELMLSGLIEGEHVYKLTVEDDKGAICEDQVTLYVTGTTATNSEVVVLSDEGVATDSMNIGKIEIGKVAKSRMYVTNKGEGEIEIDSIITDAQGATVTLESYETKLSEKKIEDVTFNVMPTAPGNLTINMLIYTNGSDIPRKVALTAEVEGSLGDPFKGIQLETWPNPAALSSKVNIGLDNLPSGQYTISVYNETGSMVERVEQEISTGKTALEVNSNKYRSGLYILTISSGKGQMLSTKIMIH